VPDRPHVQLIFLDAESGFGLGELDIGFPEPTIAPILDVGAQEVGAFRERGPVVEGCVASDAEAKACLRAVRLELDFEAGGGTLVLQDAADLPVHRRGVEPFPRVSDEGREALERFGDPLAELLVHRLLFGKHLGNPLVRGMTRLCEEASDEETEGQR
jgi:hypothetical protein